LGEEGTRGERTGSLVTVASEEALPRGTGPPELGLREAGPRKARAREAGPRDRISRAVGMRSSPLRPEDRASGRGTLTVPAFLLHVVERFGPWDWH
jgi:hypothetical protein